MIKGTNIKGFIFSATLSNGSALCLQAGDSVTIKDSLSNESLDVAKGAGLISIEKVVTEEKGGNK